MAQKFAELPTKSEKTQMPVVLTVVKNAPEPNAGLLPSERQVIEAGQGSRVRELDELSIYAKAQKITRHAYGYLGHNSKSPEEIDEMAQYVASVLEKYGNLTIREIQLALQAGLDGDFDEGKSVFFSAANLSRWIKAWYSGKRRQSVHRNNEIGARIPETTPSPLPEQIKADLIAALNGHVLQKRQHPDQIIQGAAALYEALEQFDLYRMTDDRKRQLWAEMIELNPNAETEHLKNFCRTLAYNQLLEDMVIKSAVMDIHGNFTYSNRSSL